MKDIEELSNEELLDAFEEVVKYNHYDPGPTQEMPYSEFDLRLEIKARMKTEKDYYGRD